MTYRLPQRRRARLVALMTALTCATITCAPTPAPITAGTQFMALDVVSEQAARCTQSQGSWYAGLMACACPAETLFHPVDGCRVAAAWQVDTDPKTARTMWRMGGLQIAGSIPPDISAQRLTWPACPASHTLTDALACDIEAIHATWVQSDFSSVGPHVSPWHPSSARRPTLKKACGAYLAARGFRHGDALCDTAIAMQRELRRRGTARRRGESPWEVIQHATMPEPALAQITAQWKSPVTCATYLMHLRDAGALQRHIRITAAEHEQLVLFLDATGLVTAGAAFAPPADRRNDDDGEHASPTYFDAFFHDVLPA